MTTILILAALAVGGWLAFTLVRGRDDASHDGTEEFARAMAALSPRSGQDRHPEVDRGADGGPHAQRASRRLRAPRRRRAARRARRRLDR